jgi:hypothetical protein
VRAGQRGVATGEGGEGRQAACRRAGAEADRRPATAGKPGKQPVAAADPGAVTCRAEARSVGDRFPRRDKRFGPTEVDPPCPFSPVPVLSLQGTADRPLFVRRRDTEARRFE